MEQQTSNFSLRNKAELFVNHCWQIELSIKTLEMFVKLLRNFKFICLYHIRVAPFKRFSNFNHLFTLLYRSDFFPHLKIASSGSKIQFTTGTPQGDVEESCCRLLIARFQISVFNLATSSHFYIGHIAFHT
jgi:hypothetical protein